GELRGYAQGSGNSQPCSGAPVGLAGWDFRMKRLKHIWERTVLRQPRGLADVLMQPRVAWEMRCTICGLKQGTRRDETIKRRGGSSSFDIRWKDIWQAGE